MDIVLAPDVYVNASVALGSAPDKVVQRVLGKAAGQSKTSEWVLARITHMLGALPQFKGDAVQQQVELIRGMVQIVEAQGDFGPDAWEEALVATAKSAGASRVITDHPDLLKMEESEGVEFISPEAWLLELSIPPPPPE